MESLVDEASALSFPASDPPSFAPLHAGSPAPVEPMPDGERGLAGSLRALVTALAPSLEERQEREHHGAEQTGSRMLELIADELRSIGSGAIVRRPLQQRAAREGGALESIELDLSGTTRRDEIVLVGAHYDASHGHDNVGGMAAMIELARRAAPRTSARTVRFVFFPRGELSRLERRQLGSTLYAAQARARHERIMAMMAIECVGCRAPTVRNKGELDFPTKGIVFASNLKSRRIADGAARMFREATRVPVDVVALPGAVPILRSMDHWAFWLSGYPAFAVTDTWPLRDRRFCTPAHRPERLDYRRMAGATVGLDAVVTALRCIR